MNSEKWKQFNWKLGILYFNPQDPSLFLPQRFGVGWTVNLGRPLVWVIGVLFTVVLVVFTLIVGEMAG